MPDQPTGLRKVRVRDLCVQVTSGGTPSRRRPEFFVPAGIPWLKTQELRDSRITSAQEHISDRALRESAAKLLPRDTVLVAMYGATAGQLGILDRPMTCNQACCALVPDPVRTDARFLFYALRSRRDHLKSLANGAAQQNLNVGTIANLELAVPSLPEQRAIAEVLGALDDKIDANARTRTILRSLGLAIFARALSEGSGRVLPVADCTTSVARGVAPRYAEPGTGELVLNQKCIRDGWVNTAPARWMASATAPASRRAMRGDVLVNSTGVGTLGRVARWLRVTPVAVDGHVSVVRPDPAVCPPAVVGYAMLAAERQVAALGEGSTGQTELSGARLRAFSLVLPDPAAARAVAPSLDDLDDHAEALAAESTTLTKLRDALVPALLSGELRVRDAGALVGEAV